MRPSTFLLAGALLASLPAQAQDGDATRGAELYQAKCGGCHSIETNRVGPAHRGVVGRVSGTAPEFGYSPALKAAAVTWSPENLNRWLTNPREMVPGTRMAVRVGEAKDRADIIAYLASQK